ncbi:MAG: Holliday junction branch migration protein RuvA [Bacilli bacterium]
MIAYLKGQVHLIKSNYLIIDVNHVGYEVLVATPYLYHEQEEVTLYIYTHVREDQFSLFGFNTIELKDVFLRLISVKGVGPKTALAILASIDYQVLIQAIDQNDINTLKKLPGIGLKSASQIVLDLQGKLVLEDVNINKEYNDAMEALLALGYQSNDLKKIEKKLNEEQLDTQQYIKKALQLLLK